MASACAECQALHLSNAEQCHEEATHAKGLFCWFHSKQVYGLYKGYKRRNDLLDRHDDEAPAYLKDSDTSLSYLSFEDVDDTKTLHLIHAHLFEKYVLIGQIIEARKLHHKHFYSLQVDYGHQAYIDKLSSQRHAVLRCLEKLEKRTADVLYEKERWFEWVRNTQKDEEAHRQKEQKKVKQEAAMFKRHQKTLLARLQKTRREEQQKMQDSYLETAYQERMKLEANSDETDLGDEWDPIQDVEQSRRLQYIDLIKQFLWMDTSLPDVETGSDVAPEKLPADDGDGAAKQALVSKSSKKKKAKSKAKTSSQNDDDEVLNSAKPPTGQIRLLNMQGHAEVDLDKTQYDPDKSKIETEPEMKSRLSQGLKKNLGKSSSFHLVGSLDTPEKTYDKTAPMTADEIETAIKDARVVKLLLFSRLLLSHATLLPAAIQASSVEDFLSNADIADSDLRDLCLKLEEPTLQDIRDACADAARGDEYEDDSAEDDSDDETLEDLHREYNRYEHLHDRNWLAEQASKKVGIPLQRTGSQKAQKQRVVVCGMSVWNHTSEKAMSRDGWLQFSIMAKDCELKHAIRLCRNWAEFSDLHLLTRWDYFPASSWASWARDGSVKQLQELEFYPYFMDLEAVRYSRHNQVGGRGQGRRQHDIVQTRNIMVGHMKRNDPVTRRFLQYMLMRAGEVVVLVRDGKTGRVIYAPPDEHLWTYRKKAGIGRASKNEWDIGLEVGPSYFKLTDILREWHFGFDDYYDVFIWDSKPCEPSPNMYNIILQELRNAWRIVQPRDLYAPRESILRSLTREPDTMRVRTVKPGEEVETLWGHVVDESNQFLLFRLDENDHVSSQSAEDLAKSSPYLFYNESNVVEDEVLFPDELISNKKRVPFRQLQNGVQRVESGILDVYSRLASKGVREIAEGKHPNDTLDDGSLWDIPEFWTRSFSMFIFSTSTTKEDRELTQRCGLNVRTKSNNTILNADGLEMMERERSYGKHVDFAETSLDGHGSANAVTGFKESFHAGDLQPGRTEQFAQTQGLIDKLLATGSSGSAQCVPFVAKILDWFQLRVDYDEYSHDPSCPWPHSFILHDMVRAYASMAMFFPDLDINSTVTSFVRSSEAGDWKDSALFDPLARSKVLPDRRTRISNTYRNEDFWKEWNAFKDSLVRNNKWLSDKFPLEWSVAIRPIIAKLYKAGVIAPKYCEPHPQLIPNVMTAEQEPHRPGKLDLFMRYEHSLSSLTYGPMRDPKDWPELLPLATKFAVGHAGARFALMRIWSASHFYPYMIGLGNRDSISFMDGAGRSWKWKFLAKDIPRSESVSDMNTRKRLDLLRTQFGDRVESRGDLILVMGENSLDLMKYCTAVTFAVQTKPWLREIDLWESFIDVNLEFLQGLDPFWLD